MGDHRAPELIVLDLDGTLLGLDRRVSPRNAAALHAATAAGARVVIATGRPLRLLDGIRHLVPAAVAICCNGALVIDLTTDEVLQAHPLDTSALYLAVMGARAVGAQFWVGVEGLPDQGQILLEPHADARIGVDVRRGPLAELCSPDRVVVKALIRAASSVDRDLVHRQFSDRYSGELTITHSADDLLIEVSGPRVTKGRTIAELATSWGVDASRAIAFGDGANDLELLNWAGRAVAMSNAPAEVQRVATEITGHHDEHGVATVLERWFPSET